MKNYIGPGETLNLTVPDTTDQATVASGEGFLVGSIFGVAVTDVAPGDSGPFKVEGIFNLPKTTGEAWAQGQKIYWVVATGKVTTTAGSNKLIGVANKVAASGDTEGEVVLTGAFTI